MQPICIFGVFVADLCFYAEKIPIKGETVLGNKHLVGPGGKGSNQAIAAARLEGKLNFITKMGEDSHADMAFKIYKDAGVVTNSIIKDKNLDSYKVIKLINTKNSLVRQILTSNTDKKNHNMVFECLSLRSSMTAILNFESTGC